MPPIAELQYLLEYYMLELFVKNPFSIWIQDSEPVGIWTRISGTKAVTLIIELHSIDSIFFLFTFCQFVLVVNLQWTQEGRE